MNMITQKFQTFIDCRQNLCKHLSRYRKFSSVQFLKYMIGKNYKLQKKITKTFIYFSRLRCLNIYSI